MMTSAATGAPQPSSSRASRLVAIAVAAIVLLVGMGLLVRGVGGHDDGTASGRFSTQPTSFVLPRLSGGADIRLSQFRGRPLVVNFFASWCSECRTELPTFAAASTALRGRITFVGVNSEETGDGLAMARQFHIDAWPLARDVNGNNGSGLREALDASQGMPLTALYDASGRLLTIHLGALTASDLATLLRQYDGVGG